MLTLNYVALVGVRLCTSHLHRGNAGPLTEWPDEQHTIALRNGRDGWYQRRTTVFPDSFG